MKMTKERKLYTAILTIAGLGLFVDQVIVGYDTSGPSPAVAQETNRPATTSNPSTDDGKVLPSLPSSQRQPTTNSQAFNFNIDQIEIDDKNSLSNRLQQLAENRTFKLPIVTDAFSAKGTWLEQAPMNPKGLRKGPEPGAKSAIRSFLSSHQLTAVVTGTDGGIAVMKGPVTDNKGVTKVQTVMVPVGKPINGFILLEVTAERAIFDYKGMRIHLRLDQPDVKRTNIVGDTDPQKPDKEK